MTNGWRPGSYNTNDQTASPPGVGPLPQSVRVPAGDLALRMQHPAVTRKQEMYRTLVNEAMLSPGLLPSRPFQTQMGAFTVPVGQTYFCFGQEVRIFGQDGIHPGATRPLDGEMSDVLGYVLTVNGQVQESTLFQLDPVESAATRQAFEPRPTASAMTGTIDANLFTRAVRAQFDRAATGAFASTSGQGTALRPVLSNAEVSFSGPWTVIAGEGAKVAMDLVIFRRLLLPVAFFQGMHWGYLMASNMAKYLLSTISPSAST